MLVSLTVDESHGPYRIHGTGIYSSAWMVDFDGKLVGKYTSPMDPLGGTKET